MAHQSTRRLGHVCRIYKNASGKVIALEEVEVTVDKHKIKIDKYHRAVDKINVGRNTIYLDSGSRVVATVQILGNFSSVEENGGDYLVYTWNKASDNENDIQVSLEGKVAQIGDTV